jgi:hypothetical protein
MHIVVCAKSPKSMCVHLPTVRCKLKLNLSCAGDPLFELLALYVSVFKCDQVLLECFLKSYGVPLSTHHSNGQGLDGTAMCEQLTGRDSTSLSYRAM